jgi:hypothetical protein
MFSGDKNHTASNQIDQSDGVVVECGWMNPIVPAFGSFVSFFDRTRQRPLLPIEVMMHHHHME